MLSLSLEYNLHVNEAHIIKHIIQDIFFLNQESNRRHHYQQGTKLC